MISPRRHNSTSGRARRGSRLQIQRYVNEAADALNSAILSALGPREPGSFEDLRWVSPLAAAGYAEYRDADFLRALGLSRHIPTLAAFWPKGGPSWDALAGAVPAAAAALPGVLLLEAKSHIPEIYGFGCQASSRSLPLIRNSLQAAKRWCGAEPSADWMGPLYQSANRIAHLFWFREILRYPAWLVNLYFLHDPIGPTAEPQWRDAISDVKRSLGIARPVPGMLDVFLPALPEPG